MVRIGRMIISALAVLALQGAALAQVPANEIVTFHGLTFPAGIAGAERFSVHDYEKDGPGLGYSAGYRKQGAVSTVYIYDLGKRGIPDDPSDRVIKAELEAAKSDIVHMQQKGAYPKAELKSEFVVEDGRTRTRFLCAGFALARPDRPELGSYVCLGGWNGRFLKFRITGEQQSQAEARGFVQAWTDLLWPR